MWEAIRANRRRSILLVGLMGIVLITLGASIGMYIGAQIGNLRLQANDDATVLGSLYGGGAALTLWLVLWMVAVFRGDRVLLRSAQAREIGKWDYPQLWNVVEEMKIASGLPHLPKICVVEDPAPNAFAVGRKPENAAVAVTSGLLRLLTRDELQGVIAHEMAHIRNLDIRFMQIAAVLVASVELISRSFFRAGARGGGGRRLAARGGGRRGAGRGGGQAYLLLFVFLVALLSPLLVRLLYLATSRWREYLADASAARFTHFPDGLASALEKIAVYHEGAPTAEVSGTLAALYIVNPIEKLSLAGLFSTHPPTETRIKILRGMGGRAGYVDYEAALKKIERRKLRLAALETASRAEGSVAARAATAEPATREAAVGRAREVADMIDRFANFLILPCVCGMRIKVPPAFARPSVECPRCQRVNALPTAERAVTARVQKPGAEPPTAVAGAGNGLRYEHHGRGWEAFRCACGQTIQLGPDYPLDYTICVTCNRRIEVGGAGKAEETPSRG